MENDPHTGSAAETTPPAKPLFELVSALLRRPQQLLTLWNWKSAALSTILRGPIFLVAAIRQGWQGALAALLTESVFCAVSAGFYGAIVQSLMDAEPEWLTGVLLAVVMPVVFQVLEYLLHWFRGTPHLRIAEIVSLVVSSISALFNWYAMRRGTLLVGSEGRSFGRDLYRLPALFFSFLADLPRRVAAQMRGRSIQILAGFLLYLFHAQGQRVAGGHHALTWPGQPVDRDFSSRSLTSAAS